MASFLIVIISVVLSLFIVWICGDWRKRRTGEPPLVSGLPFIGVTLDYARDPLGLIRDTRKKYGDVFTCKIVRKYFTFITDPFSFSLVVRQSKNLDFQKFAMGFSQRVFGHADFTSPVFSGSYREVHSIFRQTLQGPPLQELAQSMLGNLQAVLGRGLSREHGWVEEGLQNFTNRIMFEAGFLTLFGRDAGLLRSDGVKCGKTCMQKAAQDFLVFDRAFPALAAGVPIGLCMPAWRAREALAEELLHDELHRRNCISDLIQRRMDAFDRMHLDETGKARTHVCMLWASQANTLPAAFWSLYYTLRSAEALAAARSEVHRVLSGQALNDPDRPVSLSREQLDSMTVLESIIEEALRLSSASIMIRVAKDNFTLTLDSGETVAIRKGDFIALYPQLIHLDPDIYPDPTEFKYNRFLDERGERKSNFFKNGRRLKHFLVPFGSGVSECPGRFFAVNEIKEFLTLVLWFYDLELDDINTDLVPDGTRAGLGILPPPRDVLLKYRRRTETAG
ncbi:cytochrome P450 7A1 isoform X1 [Triplophysa rosa]|uniref:Cholesterol 7-alpha-monooxygenase-like n=1 Tax=Triplophysa rosa TaxID=992332 RepID=A0A9W7X6C5_TRIRA|nr:cytochrome P450 7A1 isoform X1 [Triplophysa rosa]KAI7814564.1 putative cholesterol 7-alpha-monooxygenase-like [Triplophysa rosa]